MRFLILGERINNRAYLKGHEHWDTHWRNRWMGEAKYPNAPSTLRHILAMPAMTEGASRKALLSLGFPDDQKVCNLLWPHGVSGQWSAQDKKDAKVCAMQVLDYLLTPEGKEVEAVFLLGRNVVEAFCFHDAEIPGERPGPFVFLNHPSGRSVQFIVNFNRAKALVEKYCKAGG